MFSLKFRSRLDGKRMKSIDPNTPRMMIDVPNNSTDVVTLYLLSHIPHLQDEDQSESSDAYSIDYQFGP